jgi:hypothetical protein
MVGATSSSTHFAHRIVVVNPVHTVIIEAIEPWELILDCRSWAARRSRQHYRFVVERLDRID